MKINVVVNVILWHDTDIIHNILSSTLSYLDLSCSFFIVIVDCVWLHFLFACLLYACSCKRICNLIAPHGDGRGHHRCTYKWKQMEIVCVVREWESHEKVGDTQKRVRANLKVQSTHRREKTIPLQCKIDSFFMHYSFDSIFK